MLFMSCVEYSASNSIDIDIFMMVYLFGVLIIAVLTGGLVSG